MIRASKEEEMRRAITVAIAATAAAGLSVALSTGGGASASGTQTLTFFEDASRGKEKLIDNAPTSPTPNPGSKRFRLSIGDELVVRTPLFDRQGGARRGTLFAKGTIVKGHRFSNAVIQVDEVIRLGNGQLTLAGIIRDQVLNAAAVTGGTGAHEGARGSATERDVNGGQGAELSIHLLH
jgi:hypothetical protein